MLKKLVCAVLFLCVFMQGHAYAQLDSLSDNFLSSEFWETASLADVQEEIKNGADVNAHTKNGATSLMAASSYSANPEIVEFLIKNGADVNARDESGSSVLKYANDNENIYDTPIYWEMKELMDK